MSDIDWLSALLHRESLPVETATVHRPNIVAPAGDYLDESVAPYT